MPTMVIRSVEDIKKITATKATKINRVVLAIQDTGIAGYHPTTLIDWIGNHPQNGKIIAGTGRFIDAGFLDKAPSTQTDFTNWFKRHWKSHFAWINTGNWTGTSNDPYENGRRYTGLKTFLIGKIGKAKHVYGIVEFIETTRRK